MISVIIPVYNQYLSLDIVLWHFTRQTITEPFEIIIVDDGSSDYDRSIFEKYPKLDIHFICNTTNKGRSYSRNIGIEKSKGEYIIFCDCDRFPTPNFIESHVKLIDSTDAILSIGYTSETYNTAEMLKEDEATISRRRSIYYKTISQIYGESGQTDSNLCWLSTLSGNMAIKKSTLDKHRFDCDFKEWGFEHFELGYRLWKENVVFQINTKAENIHIAHSRNTGFYDDCIASSHDIFFAKHPDEEVFHLRSFMLGEISLQEYEKKINNNAKWAINKSKPIMVNRFNI